MSLAGYSTNPIMIKGKPAKNRDQVLAYLEGGYESRSQISAIINGRKIGFNSMPPMAFHFCTEEDSFILYRNDWGMSYS